MSTAARKARKRAGERFTKAQKVPTPVEERHATQKAGAALLRRMLRASGGNTTAAAAKLQALAKGDTP